MIDDIVAKYEEAIDKNEINVNCDILYEDSDDEEINTSSFKTL